MTTTTYDLNGEIINVTKEQADALNVILVNNLRGFACMHNYYPKSKWNVSPEQQITFCAGGNQEVRDLKTLKALKLVTFAQLETKNWIPNKRPDSFDTAEEQFKFCLDLKIAKLEKKFEDAAKQKMGIAIELNNHQKGKRNNNILVKEGITVNLVNTTTDAAGKKVKNLDADGKQQPILTDGLATAESIVFNYVFATTKTIVEGERKPAAKSGSKVLMDKIIEKVLPDNLLIKSCTLKDGAYLAAANQHLINGLIEEIEEDEKEA
jgi:hypothetical protein